MSVKPETIAQMEKDGVAYTATEDTAKTAFKFEFDRAKITLKQFSFSEDKNKRIITAIIEII